MKRAILIVALAGCAFAQRHPAVTVGLVTGTIAFGACGLNVEKLDTCTAIGAAAGFALGGVTALATLLADTGAPPEPPPFDPDPDSPRIDTVTEPPPGLVPDAGVASGLVDAAPIAPAALDAATPSPDAATPAGPP